MARLDFGVTTLELYLQQLVEATEKPDPTQAEILAEFLVEDLTEAGRPRPPAYKGHHVTYAEGAQVFNEIAPDVITTWNNARNGNLHEARRSALRALAIFKDSPWYPKGPLAAAKEE